MMLVGSKRSISQDQVTVKLSEALEDQRADFNAQIKGMFNLIVLLNKRIERLEEERSAKSRPVGELHSSMTGLPTAKIPRSMERRRSVSTNWKL